MIIRPEQLALDQGLPLGASRTGSVFKGTWDIPSSNDSSTEQRVVAVKVLGKDVSPNTVTDHGLLLQGLEHPNVLQFFGVSPPDADPLFIVTQYHKNGNARQYLDFNPNVNRPKMVLEVALGMQYLHSNELIHGSLRPSNILINDNGQACVADISMAKVEPSNNKDAHRYFSPEAWKGAISQPSDVFAFAMSSFEMFTSTTPWGVLGDTLIFQLLVQQDTRPDPPEQDLRVRVGLTDRIWSIIEESWHKEPRFRPSFDIIVRMWQTPGGEENLFLTLGSDAATPFPRDDASTISDPGPLPAVSASRRNTLRSLSIRSSQSVPPAYDSQPSSRVTSLTLVPPGAGPPQIQIHSAPLPNPQSRRGSTISQAVVQPQPTMSTGPIGGLRDSHLYSPSPPPPTGRSFFGSGSGSDSTSPISSTSSGTMNSPVTPHSARSPLARTSKGGYGGYPAYASSPLGSPGWDSPRSYDGYHRKLPIVDEGFAVTDIAPPLPGPHDYHAPSERKIRSYTSQQQMSMTSDGQSVRSDGQSSISGNTNPVLLAGALQSEVKEGRKREVIDMYLVKIQHLVTQSRKAANKLITAGIVHTIIHLLKIRASDGEGLEVVLMTLGILAYDPISANTIYRTNTTTTLIEIFNSSLTDDISSLSVWCLNRICRSAEVALGLLKQNFLKALVQNGLRGSRSSSRSSAWCLGTLVQSDAVADGLADLGVIPEIVNHLSRCSTSRESTVDDICPGLFAVARMSRSIRLAKLLVKAGCVPILADHLSRSEDAQILDWSARAVGCLMRPNSSDMAKVMLDAGIARGLARLPSVLSSEEVHPLASFAFAIQRFSCAEWGGGTRKALVEAGVVDSLLAAVRTAADEPYPQVHVELALAVSFLGDVGGSAIRKEIVSAGGIDILKRVGKNGSPEVGKACGMAVTSITGNIWTRNAASAKTAMTHNWSGGCPDYQPPCPFDLMDLEQYESQM